MQYIIVKKEPTKTEPKKPSIVLFGLIILKKGFLPKCLPTKKAAISEIDTKDIKNNKASGENKNNLYKEQYKDTKINT